MKVVIHRIKLLEALPLMDLDIEEPVTDLMNRRFDHPKYSEYRNRMDTVLKRFLDGSEPVLKRKRKEIRKIEKESEHTINTSSVTQTVSGDDCSFTPALMFDEWWEAYPKGEFEREDKATVRAHYIHAMLRGYEEDALINAIQRYSIYCKYTRKLGTQYVIKASNFLDSDEHLMNEWIYYPEQD